MNNNNILLLLITILLFVSCKEEKIELYNGDYFIQFTKENKDTTIISFFLYPELEKIEVPLELRLIGIMPKKDLRCNIIIKEDETTASAEYYSLSKDLIFKKGQPLDTTYIVFHKKPELKTSKKKITLEIIKSEDVIPGQTNFIKRIFYISDIISKPSWWNARIESFGLGKYSDKKFQLFIEVTGVGELDKYNEYIQRNYMLQFKYYLIKMKNDGNPVLDEEGNDMLSTVPILG